MIWSKNSKARRRGNSMGMELAGALSVASQMALLCPPGFDEVVRRELACDDGREHRDDGIAGAPARPPAGRRP